MPNYEYMCKCGNEEVLLRPMKDRDKKTKCSECGKVMKRNMLSSGAFKLSWVNI